MAKEQMKQLPNLCERCGVGTTPRVYDYAPEYHIIEIHLCDLCATRNGFCISCGSQHDWFNMKHPGYCMDCFFEETGYLTYYDYD